MTYDLGYQYPAVYSHDPRMRQTNQDQRSVGSKHRVKKTDGQAEGYHRFLPARRNANAGTSHGPVSVCLCPFVTSRSSTKTAKLRITQTTPHDTPGSLVF